MPQRGEDSTLELNKKLQQVECSGLTRKQSSVQTILQVKNCKPVSMALVTHKGKLKCSHSNKRTKEKSLTTGPQNH